MRDKSGRAARIAVMEVAEFGGRARGGGARAELAMEAKRRKLDDGGFRISSPNIQLRSSRIILRDSVSQQAISHDCGSKNPSSDHARGVSSSSCCSSNGSSEGRDETAESADLEEDSSEAETSTCGCFCQRSQTTPLSELREEPDEFMDSAEKSSYGVDSTRKASDGAESMGKELDGVDSSEKLSDAECRCSCRRRSTVEKNEKMPTDAELKEFLSAAEKQLQEKFTEKYNFDFVKEKSLEGRYEWAKLSP